MPGAGRRDGERRGLCSLRKCAEWGAFSEKSFFLVGVHEVFKGHLHLGAVGAPVLHPPHLPAGLVGKG
jgi:hypothetical protein